MICEKLKESFSSNLALCLEMSNISQAELSQISGITQASISRYLSAQRLPRLTELVTISLVFDVTIDWLIGLDRLHVIPGEKIEL